MTEQMRWMDRRVLRMLTVLSGIVLQLKSNIDTERPTKDVTTETTVQNFYCLFPYIHNSLQL